MRHQIIASAIYVATVAGCALAAGALWMPAALFATLIGSMFWAAVMFA